MGNPIPSVCIRKPKLHSSGRPRHLRAEIPEGIADHTDSHTGGLMPLRWNVKITRHPEQFEDYRYRLTVEFTEQDDKPHRGNLVVVMFNPATIQEEEDLIVKPHGTRNRLIRLALDGNYRTMTELELFAYRAPKKKDLTRATREKGIDPVGAENDRVIAESVQQADRLIVAWGNLPRLPIFAERADQVTALLKPSGKQLYCFGKNQDGSPTHPARVKHVIRPWP